jgi:hypothetical protein
MCALALKNQLKRRKAPHKNEVLPTPAVDFFSMKRKIFEEKDCTIKSAVGIQIIRDMCEACSQTDRKTRKSFLKHQKEK